MDALDYGAKEGIVKKWADKYGIDIEVVQMNDYIEPINQYTAGAYNACTMTNMDAATDHIWSSVRWEMPRRMTTMPRVVTRPR